MSLSIRLVPETVRSIGFASIGAAYMGVGTALDKPARLMVFQNLTDKAVMVSFDGVNDHLPLAANGYLIMDVTANKATDDGFFLAEGTRIYVKELTAPLTSGSVYVSIFGGAS